MSTSTSVARRDGGSAELMEQVVVGGDLSKLTAADRVSYYQLVCNSLGLNPLTRPFEYLKLSGKLTLYARKDATDQLRRLHDISIAIVAREKVEEIYTVVARATTPDGRSDESLGAVPIAGQKGENLANALMKAEAKAKRRATLSIVGLGWTDATEVESIPSAEPIVVDPETGEIHEPSVYEQAVDLLRQKGLTAQEAELLARKADESDDPDVIAKLARVTKAKLKAKAADLAKAQEAEVEPAEEEPIDAEADEVDEEHGTFVVDIPSDPDASDDVMTDEEADAELDSFIGPDKPVPDPNPKPNAITPATLQQLGIVCGQLEKAGWGDEQSWRGLISSVTGGKRSRKELTEAEGKRVLKSLRYELRQAEGAAA